MRRLAVTSLLVVIAAVTTSAQDPYRYISKEQWASFEGPFAEMIEPFKILDNLYYVGAQNIGIYLFTSNEGHILLDSGMPSMPKGIIASIQKLGFNPRDVKILLSSHAHVDHVGGHAEIQKATGAQVMALGRDAEALERGMDLSPIEFLGWTPLKVNRVLKDGDTVKLGSWTLRAIHTPGHTPGNTAWLTEARDGGRTYTVLFGGAGGPNAGPPVVGNAKHPRLAEETLATFAKIRALKPPDIQLSGHPANLFKGKIDAIKTGTRPHPLLVDQATWAKDLETQEAAFRKRIAADQEKLTAGNAR